MDENKIIFRLLLGVLMMCWVVSGSIAESAEPNLAKPTAAQVVWQDMEVGMFIHFGPSVWENSQQNGCSTKLEEINPVRLDTEQWVKAAELMGAKYIVFTAKHSGGFCNWPTKTTDYSIKNTPWHDGKGDIVGDLAESCKKHGIRLGIYLSPADRKHGAKLTWGTNYSGPQGHCADSTQQPIYDEMFREQLKELLKNYGDIVELWFDGNHKAQIADILEDYPDIVVVGGSHSKARTSGEFGQAPLTCWSSTSDAAGWKPNGVAGGDVWRPVECPVPSRDSWYWFWNTGTDHLLKSADHMVEMYYQTVGHNANLLLNANPDRSGLIPEIDVKRYGEFGAEIKRRFTKPLAEMSGRGEMLELMITGAPVKLDMIMVRKEGAGGEDKLERVFQGAQVIDHVILMEDISEGQRVEEYIVEGYVNNKWVELCSGTTIGHKKIDRFFPKICTKVRIKCTKFLAKPMIRTFAVYNTSWDWWQ